MPPPAAKKVYSMHHPEKSSSSLNESVVDSFFLFPIYIALLDRDRKKRNTDGNKPTGYIAQGHIN